MKFLHIVQAEPQLAPRRLQLVQLVVGVSPTPSSMPQFVASPDCLSCLKGALSSASSHLVAQGMWSEAHRWCQWSPT